jgi:hypothetical protein
MKPRKKLTTITQRINTLNRIMSAKNITHTEKNLAYVLLIVRLNDYTAQCNPSVSDLTDSLGIHRKCVHRAIAGLQDKIDLRWKNDNFIFDLEPVLDDDDHADAAPPGKVDRGVFVKAANRTR